ncbi:hypothetical protein U1Q18_019500, partial [Sarracenia purpurea var. burkii]
SSVILLVLPWYNLLHGAGFDLCGWLGHALFVGVGHCYGLSIELDMSLALWMVSYWFGIDLVCSGLLGGLLVWYGFG